MREGVPVVLWAVGCSGDSSDFFTGEVDRDRTGMRLAVCDLDFPRVTSSLNDT